MEGTMLENHKMAVRLAEIDAELQRTQRRLDELQEAVRQLCTLCGLTWEAIGLSSKE